MVRVVESKVEAFRSLRTNIQFAGSISRCARIVGVVMNKIPTGRRGYSYYYHYHRYYDYDGDGRRRRSRRDSRPAAPAPAAPMAGAIVPRESQLNPSQK
jgi:hypothetical protein